MKNIYKSFLLALTAITAVACTDPKPAGPTVQDAELTANSAVWGSEKVEFKSVVFDNSDGMYLTVYASPAAGLNTIEKMLEERDGAFVNRFMSISILPTEINKEIDVMKDQDFIFTNKSGVCMLVLNLASGKTKNISAGTIKITAANLEAGDMSAEFDFTVTEGGKSFKGLMSNSFVPSPPPVENFLKADGKELNFKSVIFVDDKHAMYYDVIGSETEGITTYEEMMRKEGGKYVNKPLALYVGKKDLNAEVKNVMEGGHTFGMSNNTGLYRSIGTFDNTSAAAIPLAEGKFSFKYNQTTRKFSGSFDLLANAMTERFVGNLSAVYVVAPDPENNIMKFASEKANVVKTRFIKKDPTNNTSQFLITPLSGLGEHIAKVELNATLTIENSKIDGLKHDITKADAGKFTFTYLDPINAIDPALTLTNESLRNCTGWYQVTEGNDGEYTLQYEIIYGGNAITAKVNGYFDDFYNTLHFWIYPAFSPQIYDMVRSIVVDQSIDGGKETHVYMSTVRHLKTVADMVDKGDPMILKMLTTDFNGAQKSIKKPLPTITWKGVTYDDLVYSDMSPEYCDFDAWINNTGELVLNVDLTYNDDIAFMYQIKAKIAATKDFVWIK